MPFLSLDAIEAEEVVPGVRVRNVYLKSTMLSFIEYEPGAEVPEHRHLHEQIGVVLEGELEATVDGQTRKVGEGGVIAVPSNVLHSSKALTKVRFVCCSSPVMRPYKFGPDDLR